MDLKDVPDDPTICIMCKHYYCTSLQLTCKPQAESLEQFEQRVTESRENAEWYYHRCKGKLITTFNCINGKVDQKDEYCTNINTNGKCQYYYERGQDVPA